MAWAAEASNDKSAQDSKAEHKAKQMPFHGKVSAIDKTAKTIALEGKEKNRTFQITSSTKITKDGKPAIVNFQVHSGTYVVPKVLDQGYLSLGEKRFSFAQRGQ